VLTVGSRRSSGRVLNIVGPATANARRRSHKQENKAMQIKQITRKPSSRKAAQKHTCYIPRILRERMQTVDLCQTVHASRQFCRGICRQFVVYQQTTTSKQPLVMTHHQLSVSKNQMHSKNRQCNCCLHLQLLY